METITTSRLILRAFKLSDAADEFEFASLDEVGFGAGFKPHQNIEETEKILARFIAQDEVWAIELKETGRVIGSIGLHPDRFREELNTKEIGYVLSPQYQKQGLMLEAVNAVIDFAFNKQNLSLLAANHFSFNEASRKVVLKAGFNYDGIIRRAKCLYDGTKVDLMIYSLDKKQYFSKESK
ncbi:MAG: GNAT family N-acetyltransferase [Erysipelothrix sp.]|nr:GNAT family N-acetyltransferase [Erysipelothrix sp.]